MVSLTGNPAYFVLFSRPFLFPLSLFSSIHPSHPFLPLISSSKPTSLYHIFKNT